MWLCLHILIDPFHEPVFSVILLFFFLVLVWFHIHCQIPNSVRMVLTFFSSQICVLLESHAAKIENPNQQIYDLW